MHGDDEHRHGRATMSAGMSGWGYEGHTLTDLVDFAHAAGARWIVDVRLNPISRKAGFSKRALSQAIADAGLQYVHLPALGNPKDNRAGFADVGGAAGNAARQRYESDVLATDAAAEALDLVRELAARDGVVLLCFEADGRFCHRTEVLHALREEQLAA